MADVKGHGELNSADDIKVGVDQVDAVYIGETLVWSATP